jgi:hypothetical protein
MCLALIHGVSCGSVVALGLATLVSLSAEGHSPPTGAQRSTAGASSQPEDSPGPWRATGKVIDQEGHPVAGAEIWAHCGIGTLRRTGTATSGPDGRYELSFGPGVWSLRPNGIPMQAATISVHKPGFFEVNLNRKGGCLAAGKRPDETELDSGGGRPIRVFLPNRTLELNFIMRPAGRVAGKLIDEKHHPLAKYSVALWGPDLPPSSNVMCSTTTDAMGRFALEDVPTTYRFQFLIRKADPKPPWDDTWASAALRFERPNRGDFRAWFGTREIRLEELLLCVAGKGEHERTAIPAAANAGVLDLTAGKPEDVRQRSDSTLVAKSAVLTLRNHLPPE